MATPPLVEVLDGVLDDDTCAALIARIEALGPAPTQVRTERGARTDATARNNTRVWFDDAALAGRIDDAIGGAVRALVARAPGWLTGAALGCEPTFRGYRYRAGERFAPHSDAPFVRDDGARTLITVLVYLNDVEDGGTTRFPEVRTAAGDALAVTPAPGRACVFPHALLHEGVVVARGTKYALRTNVVFA